MKKNLFYLFALICSMGLFTACSDDDEDTDWMVFQTPTEYPEAKLQVTVNGTEQGYYPVTFTATSANAGTLAFKTIAGVVNDFTMDVTLQKTETGYDISGEKEKSSGYLITVKGSVALDNSKMSLEVKTSGYATISNDYGWGAFNTLTLTRNGVALDAETSACMISLKATAADKADLTFVSVIPGIYIEDADGVDIGYTVRDVAMTKAADKEVYSLAGNFKYGDATITFEGSVSEDIKMTMSVSVKIESPVVGKWGVKMNGQVADVIANVTTPEQKIVMPDTIYKYVPAELQQMITQTMTDQQIMGLAKGYLGQYVTYLKSIEFKADGNIDIIYANIGDPTEKTLSGMMNYVVKDNKLLVAPNLAAIIGMLMPTDTRAFNPGSLLNGGPLPFDYSVDGGVLSVSVDETVIGPLVSFVNGLLPFVGYIMPDLDKALLKKIGDIVTFVDKTIIPTDEEGNPVGGGAKLEVGLKLTK